MYIYMIKQTIGFYDNPEDLDAEKLYERLLDKYGCQPVIIPVEASEESEFEVTGHIAKEHILRLVSQQIPEEACEDTEPEAEEETEKENKPEATCITAYTDGSYNVKTGIAGYAAVIGDKEEILSGSITDPELTSMRNVAGELQAVISVIEFAQKNGAKKAIIYYDYEGIEKWYTGEWKAKKAFTQQYRDYLRNAGIEIEFHKVKAHSGIAANELADRYAKASCGM